MAGVSDKEHPHRDNLETIGIPHLQYQERLKGSDPVPLFPLPGRFHSVIIPHQLDAVTSKMAGQ